MNKLEEDFRKKVSSYDYISISIQNIKNNMKFKKSTFERDYFCLNRLVVHLGQMYHTINVIINEMSEYIDKEELVNSLNKELKNWLGSWVDDITFK